MHVYTWTLLEWFTTCGTASPTMAVSRGKDQEYSIVQFTGQTSQQSQSGSGVSDNFWRAVGL